MGPAGAALIVFSLVFVVAGVVVPQAAEALLRLLLATLVIGFILFRAQDGTAPARSTHDTFTPFDGYADPRPPPSAPWAVHEIAHDIEAVDDERLAAESPIPWLVCDSLTGEVARRLEESHGLRLDVPDHRAAIRAAVAEPTWRLIASAAVGEDASAGPRAIRRPPLSQLGRILDDMESL